MKLWQTILALALASLLLLSGCNNGPSTVKDGDVVKVNYTGRLEDGTVFDSSEGKVPLEFEVGGGRMIQGFDAAIPGMKPGKKKTVTIPPEKAYGLHRDDLLKVVEKSTIPGDTEPEVGMYLNYMSSSGVINAYPIVAVSEVTVTIDMNHYLAGKTLIFDIELVEIVKPAS